MKRRDFIAGLMIAAWPKAVPAAEPAVSSRQHHIGVVSPVVPVTELTASSRATELYPAFFGELQRLGYVEEKNLVIERRSAEGVSDRYDEIARDLLDRNVEVVFIGTARMAVQFKRSMKDVPIVVVGAGLERAGLVESLSHPGGNVTGFSVDAGLELYGKHLQLLRDLVPSLKKVGSLAPRSEWESPPGKAVSTAARALGIELVGPPVEAPLEKQNYLTALTSMAEQDVDGLIVSLANENVRHAKAVVDFAKEHRLPAIYPLTVYAQNGALITYATNLGEIGIGCARYVDIILKGARPKDLPVQQPVKFELIINLAEAKALGIDVSTALLASADRVIE
jgi:putative ABC transport system substrate-binding protein